MSAGPSAMKFMADHWLSLQGIVISIFVQSWSVMVRIELYPADSGSFTMKSIDMVWNGSAPIASVIGFSGAF